MPTNKIKADSKRLHKPVKELEALWDNAKKIASSEDISEDSDKYYPYVMGIYKNMTECSELAHLFTDIYQTLFENKNDELSDDEIDKITNYILTEITNKPSISSTKTFPAINTSEH